MESVTATNQVIVANKKDIDGKSNRLYNKIEKGDKELSLVDDEIRKLIWQHKKENAQLTIDMHGLIDKTNDKIQEIQ